MNSLRFKVTLIVLLLGLPFLVASIQGLRYASEQSNLQERKSFAKRAFNRLAKDLKGEDPRSRIAAIYEQSGLDGLGAGVTLIDRAGVKLWQSPRRAPEVDQRGVQQQNLDQGTLLFVMPEKQDSTKLNQLAWVITVVGLLAYGLGAWLLVGLILRPVSKLLERVDAARSDSELSIKAPSSDREIVDLVDTLNGLTQEIRQDGLDRINSYATLSHELRTPIHSLLLKLDLALSEERTKEELESTLIETQAQVFKLKKLSEAVLTLQRLASTDIARPIESLDVQKMFEVVISDMEPLIELRSLTFETYIPAEMRINGSIEYFELLVRNLLENAAKYSSRNSVVEIKAGYEESGVKILIENSVDRENLLAGNRLGLRICHEIARSCKWKLVAEEESGRFTAMIQID